MSPLRQEALFVKSDSLRKLSAEVLRRDLYGSAGVVTRVDFGMHSMAVGQQDRDEILCVRRKALQASLSAHEAVFEDEEQHPLALRWAIEGAQ